jgi:hypothetical protein
MALLYGRAEREALFGDFRAGQIEECTALLPADKRAWVLSKNLSQDLEGFAPAPAPRHGCATHGLHIDKNVNACSLVCQSPRSQASMIGL